MQEIKTESNVNLICRILELIEEKPYCSLSSIELKNYDNDSVLAQLIIILKEKLIRAEIGLNEKGEIINLFNIHLTLNGLLYLKKLNFTVHLRQLNNPIR
ncbi:MAG: hypothetical protein ACM34N_15310 [Ignavibacteria bacterium]